VDKKPLKHTYRAAEKFILSREFFGMKLGLENISGFLSDIGSPQDRYPTIHLSGTNGKGSTAAMLASIIQKAGFKTGLFTSPHLVSLRERVRVDGRAIPERSVAAFIDRHRSELSRRKISFFELTAAMAFEHFARVSVDIAVIETGLGGRLDATNVLHPLLTITTDISRDHVEILGNSLSRIAWEKAGIVKEHTPHLIGLLPPPAVAMMRKVCRERHARLYTLSKRSFRSDPESARLSFNDADLHLDSLNLALPGEHQARNAALALRAVSICRKSGLRITKRAIRDGLAETSWPGRFQILKRNGLPTTVLDVGHNEKGVLTVVDTFRRRFPGRRAQIVTGFVKRKPHQAMVDALRKIAERFWLVPLATHRSIDLDELLATIDFGEIPIRRMRSLRQAIDSLARQIPPDDVVLVVGSHYLVGEYLEKYGNR